MFTWSSGIESIQPNWSEQTHSVCILDTKSIYKPSFVFWWWNKHLHWFFSDSEAVDQRLKWRLHTHECFVFWYSSFICRWSTSTKEKKAGRWRESLLNRHISAKPDCPLPTCWVSMWCSRPAGERPHTNKMMGDILPSAKAKTSFCNSKLSPLPPLVYWNENVRPIKRPDRRASALERPGRVNTLHAAAHKTLFSVFVCVCVCVSHCKTAN